MKSGPRPFRPNTILAENPSESEGDMALIAREKDKEVVSPPLPARYRLRDLILGDYAFNDDGERLVPFVSLISTRGNNSIKIMKSHLHF